MFQKSFRSASARGLNSSWNTSQPVNHPSLNANAITHDGISLVFRWHTPPVVVALVLAILSFVLDVRLAENLRKLLVFLACTYVGSHLRLLFDVVDVLAVQFFKNTFRELFASFRPRDSHHRHVEFFRTFILLLHLLQLCPHVVFLVVKLVQVFRVVVVVVFVLFFLLGVIGS